MSKVSAEDVELLRLAAEMASDNGWTWAHVRYVYRRAVYEGNTESREALIRMAVLGVAMG